MARAERAGELARLAAAGRNDPDVLTGVAITAFVPRRDKGDLTAVRRPGNLAVVPVAVGELARLAAVKANDKGVPAAAVKEADAVELVLERGDDARRWRTVVGGLLRPSRAGREGD